MRLPYFRALIYLILYSYLLIKFGFIITNTVIIAIYLGIKEVVDR
jgi:hypothetical protein